MMGGVKPELKRRADVLVSQALCIVREFSPLHLTLLI